MFSIPLDDAMAFRADGKLTRARQCVEIALNFVTGLTGPLSTSCQIMDRWGRELAIPPSVAPFNPSFYRTDSARQNAQWNQLMHMVLFGSRARFLHKLHVLGSNTITLGEEFYREGEELAQNLSFPPESSWPKLDQLHDDLNTCLREIVVILKSFLLALPPTNLPSFHRDLTASAAASRKIGRPAPIASLSRLSGSFRRQ